MSIISIRQSQIVSTYGPGSLVDFPAHAIIVAGLDHWMGEARLVPEERLVGNLRRRMSLPALELRAPPVPDREDQPDVGVVAWQFPEWFVAQYEEVTAAHGRSRPLLHRRALIRGRYVAAVQRGTASQRSPVVPVRFVQGCPNGHISDIDWPRLVHSDGAACGGQLWLDERGTTGDLSELFLRCSGCERPPVPLMRLQNSGEEASILGLCNGERPWLGPIPREVCVGPNNQPHRSRLLIRHASNAYFPIIERVISLPDAGERVRKAVDALWDDFLSVAEDQGDITRERRKTRVQQALEGLTDAEVWAECERRHSGGGDEADRSLKDVELETFLAVPEELGDDRPEGDFHARRLPLPAARSGAMDKIDRLVLVHRLREVVTEVGFTRFEPPAVLIGSEIDLDVRVASLALDTRWLPAVENRGEGIFLALQSDAVQQWLRRPALVRRAAQFHAGVMAQSKKPVSADFVQQIYMPYVLLHSLSHLLLTAVALECGYAAASIRERIYVRDGAYGLLLYTGTPDAEGTLGGLVQVGRRLGRHLDAALEMGRLCSNDPVCAQHKPDETHEGRLLHGAACHGCLLIAESSCEHRNELLDRSLVVPTVDMHDAAFFAEEP